MRSKFARACESKMRKMKSNATPSISCEQCCEFTCWPFAKEADTIPKDVPKGHLVVYVGESYKRFVVKISVLKHPLFKALLDQARDVYDFTTDSRLCIPCDESTFLDVVRCAGSPQHPSFSLISNSKACVSILIKPEISK